MLTLGPGNNIVDPTPDTDTIEIGDITQQGNYMFDSNKTYLLTGEIDVGTDNTVINTNGTLQVTQSSRIDGNYEHGKDAILFIGGDAVDQFNAKESAALIVSGAVTLAQGSTVQLDLRQRAATQYRLASGQHFYVITAAKKGTNFNSDTLNYQVGGWTGGITGASITQDNYNSLVLTLGNNINRVMNLTFNANSTQVLSGLFNSGMNVSLNELRNAALAAAETSTAAGNHAGAQLSPMANTVAATQASTMINGALLNAATEHMDSLRTTEQARDGQRIMWGKTFAGQSLQSQRDDVSGYHANYTGLLIGADTVLSDNWRAGGLFGYANTRVGLDDDNAGSSVRLNSYGVLAYASYTAQPWYTDFTLGAVQHQYNSQRLVNLEGFTGNTSGSYQGMNYLAAVQAGYPITLPYATLTPIAGLSYSALRQDAYTENGGNGAALQVDGANSTSLKSNLGIKLSRVHTTAYGELVPYVQLTWRHEYHQARLQSSAFFAADKTGVTRFSTQGPSVQADTGELLRGASLMRSKNLDVSAHYTLEAAAGYSNQAAGLKMRYQF